MPSPGLRPPPFGLSPCAGAPGTASPCSSTGPIASSARQSPSISGPGSFSGPSMVCARRSSTARASALVWFDFLRSRSPRGMTRSNSGVSKSSQTSGASGSPGSQFAPPNAVLIAVPCQLFAHAAQLLISPNMFPHFFLTSSQRWNPPGLFACQFGLNKNHERPLVCRLVAWGASAECGVAYPGKERRNKGAMNRAEVMTLSIFPRSPPILRIDSP